MAELPAYILTSNMSEASINKQLEDCTLTTQQMRDVMQMANVLRSRAGGMPGYTHVQMPNSANLWSFPTVRRAYAFFLKMQSQ
jgi:hypothetical protein